jgi:hypothetical protein
MGHPGNLNLRDLIQASVGSAARSTTEEKNLKSRGVLAQLKLAGSRFLTRHSNNGAAETSWYQLRDVEAESLIFGCFCTEESAVQAVLRNVNMGAVPNRGLHDFGTSEAPFSSTPDAAPVPTAARSSHPGVVDPYLQNIARLNASERASLIHDELSGRLSLRKHSKDLSEDENKSSKRRKQEADGDETAGGVEKENAAIRPGDIVCSGRGRSHYSHPGNQRMLNIIHLNKARYKAATKAQKHIVAREVMDAIKDNGRRFLKRKGVDRRWEEIDDEEALKKVCHSIRHCLWNQEAKDKEMRGDTPLPIEIDEDTDSEAASSTMEEDRKIFLEMAVADEAMARNGDFESSIRSVRQLRLELQASTPDAAADRLSHPGVVDPYLQIRLTLAAQRTAAAAHPH